MRPILPFLLAGLLASSGAWVAAQDAGKPSVAADVTGADNFESLHLPDVLLTDQNGLKVHFVSDLIQGKMVAINFVFTSCTTICPLQGAAFGELQGALRGSPSNEVVLVSISLDPETDTPERLKAWGRGFHAGPSWHLLTGKKREVDKVLRAFQIPVADKVVHQPLVMVGDPAGRWVRINSLAPAAKIAEVVNRLRPASPPGPQLGASPAAASPAQHYFPDTVLLDQDGHERHFYSDLLRGHVVVINSFFATCRGSCPIMLATFARVQERLAEHMGKELCLLSISVDPDNDTPAKLKAYATELHAGPGWYLLTGTKPDVDAVLGKLGLRAPTREEHSNLFLIGNEPSGLWKKAFGLGNADDIVQLVDGVMRDPVPATSAQPSAHPLSGGKE